MLQHADLDNDGAITLEEFRQFRAMRFAKRDANGDGVLTVDECPKNQGRHKGVAS